MARLLSPPLVELVGWEPLSGPRAVGAGATQSIGNFLQTFSSPFGLWRMRFLFPPFEGQEARRFRGWVSALHGGANATRWSFFDPDRMSFQEAGVDATDMAIRTGQPWSNGQAWSNGLNWATSQPTVPISAPAARDSTIVNLSNSFWGHRAGVGDFNGTASDPATFNYTVPGTAYHHIQMQDFRRARLGWPKHAVRGL